MIPFLINKCADTNSLNTTSDSSLDVPCSISRSNLSNNQSVIIININPKHLKEDIDTSVPNCPDSSRHSGQH